MELLLQLASAYFMLADTLEQNGIDGKHYIESGNNCLAKYSELKYPKQIKLIA